MQSLIRYYKAQVASGVSPAKAALFTTTKGFRQWGGTFKKQTVTHGFGLYHLPLLASYSRSGTNWIRYVLESITNLPTPGEKRLISGNNYCIDRAHCAFQRMESYQTVILVLRDYRECLLRHHHYSWPDYADVATFLSDETLTQPASWYIRNIEAFEAFQGEKLLLYYEDLMTSPTTAIQRLSQFLELDSEKTDQFLKNLDFHFSQSVQAYTRKKKVSYTASSKNLTFHADTKLRSDQVQEFDEFYFSRYPSLAQTYLHRYDTRNSGSMSLK